MEHQCQFIVWTPSDSEKKATAAKTIRAGGGSTLRDPQGSAGGDYHERAHRSPRRLGSGWWLGFPVGG